MKRPAFLAALAAAGAPAVTSAAPQGQALWHVAIFRFAPEHTARAVDAFRRLRSASRTHAGNISYDVYRSPDDPQSFFIVERWSSPAALAAHERTPVFAELGRDILTRYALLHDTASGIVL